MCQPVLYLHVVTHPIGEFILCEDWVGVEEEVVVGVLWRVAQHLLGALPAAEHRGQLRELPLRRLPHRLQLLSAQDKFEIRSAEAPIKREIKIADWCCGYGVKNS